MSSMRECRQGGSGNKLIAFTFDDGPHSGNTPKLLDLAATTAIKLTFFLVGQRIERHSDIIRRQASEGHELGNHSWSHPDLTTLDCDTLRSEIEATDDAIFQHGGIKASLFRPPYGRITQTQREWLNNVFGYKTILWTIDSRDWQSRNSEAISAMILREARPGAIVLLHDIHRASIEAMSVTFESLLSDAYELVTVSELLDRVS